MWVVFSSILHAGNVFTPGLFVYCTGAPMGCCEGKMKMNVQKYEGIS